MSTQKNILPAEWHTQLAVQLTWPHAGSDWADRLNEAESCFVEIAEAIAARQQLIIVCDDAIRVKKQLKESLHNNILFFECPANDTWARDHGGITVLENGKPVIYDFCFNGWGMKFAANHDNLITRQLSKHSFFEAYGYQNMNFFVFEGGSIESDGRGTLLTTSACLLSANRNDSLSQHEIEACMQQFFGADRILWLNHGYLAGDDTDSHIDTLARFCDESTIAYVQCTDRNDEHYEALKRMEEELKQFRQPNGEAYRLVPLPMAKPVYDKVDGHRLPATYANLLIINEAVLLPVYNCPTDEAAIHIMQQTFPDREIVPVDCSILITQHGSLHCVSMQYPKFD
jgi:agmatine/peptidylarginine deiminase